MANRFPLTIDGSTIKELPSGDNLDLTGSGLVTVSNADIELDPNGSGTVIFKGNATKGAGQFKLNCENNSHGITIKGPPHSAAASYTLTLPNTDGNADQVLKTNGSGVLDWVDSGGGGGGAWNVISSSTLNSSTSYVEFTLSGYDDYVLKYSGVNNNYSSANVAFHITQAGGSYNEDVKYVYSRWGGHNSVSRSESQNGGVNRVSASTNASVATPDGNLFGQIYISTMAGQSGGYGWSGSIDDTNTYHIGFGHYVFAYDSPPSSTAKIGKIKVVNDNGGTLRYGTFTLYGLSTS